MNEFEELDVVVAVERGVDVNGKLHLVRLTHFSTQLLHFPVTLIVTTS